MADQLSLFDPHTKARRTDPATSHVAAESARGLAAAHRGAILYVLAQHGEGLTAGEIATYAGLDSVQVSRRLAELREASEIVATGEVRPTSSGRPAQVWRRA